MSLDFQGLSASLTYLKLTNVIVASSDAFLTENAFYVWLSRQHMYTAAKMTAPEGWAKETATDSWTHSKLLVARHEASQACAETLAERSNSSGLMHKKGMLRAHDT